MSANNVHPFSPSSDGVTCNEVLYPAYERCGKGPKSPAHDGTRPAPPRLEFPHPPCSLCGKDTYFEGDRFRCDPCGASWSDNGFTGNWDDPSLLACGATRKPFDRPDLSPENEAIRHQRDYCIRETGHAGPHRADEFSEWE